jgi:hypothetical protein
MSRRAIALPWLLVGNLAIIGVVTAAARADSCQNSAFRTGPSAALPDCRAYELVTPAFKFGAAVTRLKAADGSHVQFSSITGFSGAPDDQGVEGSDYIASRTASGWSAVPVDPPATEFQNGATLGAASPLEDVSRDFSTALVAGIPAASTPLDKRLYIRRQDGLTEVGPVFPPEALATWTGSYGDFTGIYYEGGSADLSHVVFEIKAGQGTTHFLWPGDTTVQNASLYEYVGTGSGTPRLVGVDNAGHLISQCGTGLGGNSAGGNTDMYNAISADGNTIFFDAEGGGCSRGESFTGTGPPVAELYARIDGTRTVAISEPALPSGALCTRGHACFEAPLSPGVFQGASEDGRRVFFLTEQPLVNGDEDSGIDLYMAELEGSGADTRVGRLVQVSQDEVPGQAAEVLGVARVSMDGTHAYFVAQGVLTNSPNRLGQAPVAGADNLYVYEPDPAHAGQSRIAFVTTLSAADGEDWQRSDLRRVDATPDGRFLLFASRNGLTPDCPRATCTGQQLYRYDSQTGELLRVSIGDGGFNQNGTKADFAITPEAEYVSKMPARQQPVSMSDDGSYVFFSSPAALTPQAINDPTDTIFNVYEYHEGHVYLISDGRDRHLFFGVGAVTLIGASRSGGDVYFTTGDQLASQDTDTQVDIYDARIGGGFPPAAAPVQCQGDGCQSPLAGLPSAPAPGSVSYNGPGNLTQPGMAAHVSGLSGALRACRTAHRRRRRRCETAARRRFSRLAKVRTHGRGPR